MAFPEGSQHCFQALPRFFPERTCTSFFLAYWNLALWPTESLAVFSCVAAACCPSPPFDNRAVSAWMLAPVTGIWRRRCIHWSYHTIALDMVHFLSMCCFTVCWMKKDSEHTLRYIFLNAKLTFNKPFIVSSEQLMLCGALVVVGGSLAVKNYGITWHGTASLSLSLLHLPLNSSAAHFPQLIVQLLYLLWQHRPQIWLLRNFQAGAFVAYIHHNSLFEIKSELIWIFECYSWNFSLPF